MIVLFSGYNFYVTYGTSLELLSS